MAAYSPRLSWPEREFDRTPLNSAKVKKVNRFISVPLYICLKCCLRTGSYNFIFTWQLTRLLKKFSSFIESKYCTPCHRKLPLDPVQPWSNSFSFISSQRFRVAPFNFTFVFQMSQLHIILRQNFVALFIFHFWGLSPAHRHLRLTVPDRKCRLWGLRYVIIATCCSTSYVIIATCSASYVIIATCCSTSYAIIATCCSTSYVIIATCCSTSHIFSAFCFLFL